MMIGVKINRGTERQRLRRPEPAQRRKTAAAGGIACCGAGSSAILRFDKRESPRIGAPDTGKR